MNTTVLCVDIGTTSLKTALIAKHSRILEQSRQELDSGSDAAQNWIHALGRAVSSFNKKQKITAVCISGNGPTIVSSSGKTLLWNVPAAATLPAATDKDNFLEADEPITDERSETEKTPITSLFIPRLLTFKKFYPAAWKIDRYIFSGPEYLLWRLTDNAFTILPETRYTDYYWTDKQLIQAGFTAEEMNKLPHFISPTCFAGKVTKEAEELTGIKARTRVFCGAPDFIAALVGTNTLKSGDMYDRAGSSEGINLCSAVPIYGKNIRTLPSIIPDLWNASILIPESGSRFASFRTKVQFQTKKNYSSQALADEIILHGGGHLPIPLAVEGRELIVRLAQEIKAAVATLTYAAFRTHVDTPEGRANESVPLPDSMTLSGGQATNMSWSRYKCSAADITGRVPVCTDAELMGDNIFARVGMGEFKSIEQAAASLVKIEACYFPTTTEI